MHYTELPCRPELAPWIAAHWHFRVHPDAGAIEHHVPLTGGALLTLVGRPADSATADATGATTPAALLAGPRVSPLVTTVRGGEVYWGTHLWPGAARALLGNAVELREAMLPAAVLLGEAWCAALSEELLCLNSGRPSPAPAPSTPAVVSADAEAQCGDPRLAAGDAETRAAAMDLVSGADEANPHLASWVNLAPATATPTRPTCPRPTPLRNDGRILQDTSVSDAVALPRPRRRPAKVNNSARRGRCHRMRTGRTGKSL